MIPLLLGSVACTTQAPKTRAIDLADMDTSVNPGDDFDNYANGGWKKRFPIPADKSRFGTFDLLSDTGEVQVQRLIDEIAAQKQEPGSIAQKIADYYNTGMDTAKIEADGLKQVQPFFDEIASIKNTAELMNVVSGLQKQQFAPMFFIFSEADQKNSQMQVAYLFQGGLGMADRDYYMKDDQRSKDIQAAYVAMLQKMFTLTGTDEATAKKDADVVYKIEKQLASASMTRLELRDPHKSYHKMKIADLQKIAPEVDWTVYFRNIGVADPGDFIVGQPDFFAELNKMLKQTSLDGWKTYLNWQVVRSLASYLPQAYGDASFDFYGKTLSGQMAQRPRWKRVQGATDRALGEALGQMYVKKYFPAEAKQRSLDLVNNLKAALGERIKNLTWMSDTTKQKALEKLAAIDVKIGYPDKWRDYSNLKVSTDSYVANAINSRVFDFDFMISKVNKPVDRTEWMMSPQTVNAYYNPSKNEIVFPAAILQPPFFFMDGDDAVNYGAIGVVMGHEMTHGFDDQGRQYDKFGNLQDWWTAEDSKKFNERAQVLVKQFDSYTLIDSLKANGQLTLGENIADLGGLNIAYTALQKVLTGNEKPIDGFTPDQRFFLAYAHLWAQNIRDKEIARRTKEDVHSIGRFRVLGPLRNMPEFYKAFDVKPGQFMYLPENERAVIW